VCLLLQYQCVYYCVPKTSRGCHGVCLLLQYLLLQSCSCVCLLLQYLFRLQSCSRGFQSYYCITHHDYNLNFEVGVGPEDRQTATTSTVGLSYHRRHGSSPHSRQSGLSGAPWLNRRRPASGSLYSLSRGLSIIEYK